MISLEKFFFKNAPHWKHVKLVLERLHKQDFEVALVGGSVRDALLKRSIQDFDIATSATPEQVLKIFPKAKDTWKKYGVVFLPLGKEKKPLCITTFRKEQSYKDGRRPNSVSYSSLEEDSKRRDFTINALYYSLGKEKILDFTKGQEDLKKKIIRSIGNANERFEEDRLRPLRALRFAHQLKFSIERKTQKSIHCYYKKILSISKERIYSELTSLFQAGRIGDAVKLLHQYQFFDTLFPSLKDQKKYYSFWNKRFSFYEDPHFTWAVLGLPYFINGNIKDEFLRYLKAPSLVVKGALFYMGGVRSLKDPSESFINKLRIIENKELQMKELSLSWFPKNKEIQNLFKIFKKIKTSQNTLPKPLVTGSDLLKRKILPKEFKNRLDQVFEYQIKNKLKRKKDALIYIDKINS